MAQNEWERLNIQEETQDMMGRFLMLGATASEISETIGRMKTFADWCRHFRQLGARYEERGNSAAFQKEKLANYGMAAAYYHIAQLLVHQDNEEKRQTYAALVSVYAKAMKYFANPTRRVEIPFENISLPGYFRKRPDLEQAPCVMIIGGADSSKEAELHRASEVFLSRGLFTLVFDGPGQGETRFRGVKMRSDFEQATSAALDWLKGQSEVDTNRIAIYGPSLGGYLAPRSAAFDKRVKACVSAGGFYSLDEFADHFPLRVRRTFWLILGVSTSEEWARERKRYSLEGILENVTCPLLVINGADDKTVPVSQSLKIYARANCTKNLRIYEGADHCAANKPEALPSAADWMVRTLETIGQVRKEAQQRRRD